MSRPIKLGSAAAKKRKKPRSFPEIPELVPRASATAKTRARVMKKMTKPAKPGSAAAKTADGTNTGPRAGAGAKLGAKARARAMEENDEACEAWCLHYEEQEAGWLLHTSCATILTKTRNRVVAYETIVTCRRSANRIQMTAGECG